MRTPEKIIIVGGLAMIVGAFAIFGKKKLPPQGPDVPVPYDPPGVDLLFGDGHHFSYKGVFITVRKPPLSSTWRWVVRGTADTATAPLAVSPGDAVFNSEEAALGDAMQWVDTFKGGA